MHKPFSASMWETMPSPDTSQPSSVWNHGHHSIWFRIIMWSYNHPMNITTRATVFTHTAHLVARRVIRLVVEWNYSTAFLFLIFWFWTGRGVASKKRQWISFLSRHVYCEINPFNNSAQGINNISKTCLLEDDIEEEKRPTVMMRRNKKRRRRKN